MSGRRDAVTLHTAWEDKMFSLSYTTLDIVIRETQKNPDFVQIVKIELY